MGHGPASGLPFPGSSPFFVLEGLDGSGKSTQMRLLKEALAHRGHAVETVREPGGTPVSQKIREILLDNGHSALSPMAELMLYSAARAQLVHQIILPALRNGRVVLADRFAWSTLAYQGHGRGMDLDLIHALIRAACGEAWPLHNFLLDLPPESMAARLHKDGRRPDRMENEAPDFHRRVREGYLALARANPGSFTVLDAGLAPESLHARILEKALGCIQAAKKEISKKNS